MQITKYILPVIVGAMSGMIMITLGETWIHHIYPMPANTDLYDSASLAKYVASLPGQAFMMMLANYIICSYLAGLVSTLVIKGESMRPAMVVGIVLTLAGLYYVLNIHYPTWFAVINLLVYLPFTMLGYFTVKKRAA